MSLFIDVAKTRPFSSRSNKKHSMIVLTVFLQKRISNKDRKVHCWEVNDMCAYSLVSKAYVSSNIWSTRKQNRKSKEYWCYLFVVFITSSRLSDTLSCRLFASCGNVHLMKDWNTTHVWMSMRSVVAVIVVVVVVVGGGGPGLMVLGFCIHK